jgi:hypothetical protein
VIDGTNVTFTLAATPSPATSLVLYRNGLKQQQGGDYNIQADGSIVFTAAAVPQTGDALLASYRTESYSSEIVVPPPNLQTTAKVQVLCSGSGAGTSSVNLSLLGNCMIPAGTLAMGDRVEVRFNFSHQGSARAFTFQVNWNHATMVLRSASSRDVLATGHGDASVTPAGTVMDMQTWGTQLTLDSRVAMTSDQLTKDIPIDFLACLTAAGTDVVSLQNFTVLRYPAAN